MKPPPVLERISRAVFGLAVLAPALSAQRVPTQPVGPLESIASGAPVTSFAVIGDYGDDGPDEADVAALVHGLQPDFVITVGDNNYLLGEASTIDANVGKHYHDFIGNYGGSYGPGSSVNRFFPCLGNHDWGIPGAPGYLAYFTLPGNERYYDFVRGPVHFFALDSDGAEPDGHTANSVQGAWLQAALAAATEPFKVVYFHHPPYSSGNHGPSPAMQWPFRAWGASVVLAGHDHHYERIVADGFPYFVNGLGGAGIYAIGTPLPGSEVRYNLEHGAMFVEATNELMTLRFVSSAGFVQDVFALRPSGVDPPDVALVSAGTTWRYKDDGIDPPAQWIAMSYDDSSWSSGAAQLGYGDGDEQTVVQSGPAGNAYTTTWFRRTFQVVDPSVIASLSLELIRDDGAVVCLNGVEVFRSNMPVGAITSATLAASNVSGADESTLYLSEIAPTLLVAGNNVLAVEVHQSGPTSSDVSFDLALRAELRGTRLVASGDAWKFRDTGVAPNANWMLPAFDDSSWSSGPSELGYGDGDEATVVSFGPDANHKHVTTWFRRTFTAGPPATFNALLLRLVRDDGVVVYLNGIEVFRQNLPRLGLTSASTCEYAIANADESTWIETYVDPRLLLSGANVLAVEIHQQSPTSSDISFDLELYGL